MKTTIAWPIRAEFWRVDVRAEGTFTATASLLENCLLTIRVAGVDLEKRPLYACPSSLGIWLSQKPEPGVRFPKLVLIGEGDLSAEVQSCVPGYEPKGWVTVLVKGYDEEGDEVEYFTAAKLIPFGGPK